MRDSLTLFQKSKLEGKEKSGIVVGTSIGEVINQYF